LRASGIGKIAQFCGEPSATAATTLIEDPRGHDQRVNDSTDKAAIFGPEAIAFLSELAVNNDRAWFADHKQRYEQHVCEPALTFVSAIAPGLEKISRHFVANPKRTGGSLMRIYRDTRFSKSKLPYKTNVGIHFRHARGRDVHAPGFYVHIEPGDCFIGAGIWRPDSEALGAIRAKIADAPHMWRRARYAKSLTAQFELAGESLQRMPRGFSPELAEAGDIRRKDFIAISHYEIGEITEPEFVDYAIARFSDARPLMRFLCSALGLAF
jgi:uncharacterized protein (TIGR02453 family)